MLYVLYDINNGVCVFIARVVGVGVEEGVVCNPEGIVFLKKKNVNVWNGSLCCLRTFKGLEESFCFNLEWD